jgi:hypothetical protein
MNPLTHHDIMQLVGPFTRRGRQVDLASCDRVQRRVAFKPIEHPASMGCPCLRETLALEDSGSGSYRLCRLLMPPAGPAARLEAVGPDPCELLARIVEVPPRRQFRSAGGVFIAVSFRLAPQSTALIFASGAAQVADLIFTVDTSTLARGPASVTLTRPPGDTLRLPPDTLAVLGGRWSRLRDAGEGWAGELWLSGRESRRSLQAEHALASAVLHLSRILEDTPARFHERFVVARWRVFCRRLVPLAACIGLILCAAAVPRLHLPAASGLRMLILNSPPLLMIAFFCLREVPIVEIPPLPRRPVAASWREGPAAPAPTVATSAPTVATSVRV